MAKSWEKLMAAMEAEARRNEKQYRSALARLISWIRKILAAAKSPSDVTAALRKLSVSRELAVYAEKCARRMAVRAAVSARRTWREAASESMQGRRVYTALQRQVNGTALGSAIEDIVSTNSRLIRTVPMDVAEDFSRLAQKRQMEGLRPEHMMAEMQREAPDLAGYKIRRIARTESAKAATALTQTRAMAIGCEWYIWHSCQDERVRDSHAKMEGVICKWTDPPAPESLFPGKYKSNPGPYHPGGIYNCRCIALPIISMEDVESFPCKVHISGRIVTARTHVELKRLTGQDMPESA